MAWGASTSIDGWLNKLSRNDPSFTSLHVLSSRKLTQNQFQELFAALSSNTSLAEFNASGHFLDHRSLEVLSDALSNNEHIKSLCIGNCELRDEGVLFIVQGLKNNKSLEVLDLEYKGIGNDGCVALAQLISVHSSLKDIRLSRNSISDEGFVSLFSNLHRSNIQKIDLGYNHVLGVGFDSFLIEVIYYCLISFLDYCPYLLPSPFLLLPFYLLLHCKVFPSTKRDKKKEVFPSFLQTLF